MTGFFFSADIVPTCVQKEAWIIESARRAAVRGLKRPTTRYANHRVRDKQASGETLTSCAHSAGRQTKCRAAEAVAGRSGIPGNAQNLSGAGLYP